MIGLPFLACLALAMLVLYVAVAWKSDDAPGFVLFATIMFALGAAGGMAIR